MQFRLLQDVPNNMNIETTNRRIVCAANKYGDIILLGPRHWDSTMREQYTAQAIQVPHSEFEQGFINTWGEFLNRKEAWMVACINNQVILLVGGQTEEDKSFYGTKLYSENLY